MSRIRIADLSDTESVLRIYAPFCSLEIPTSFEITAPSPEEMRARIQSHSGNLPWLIYEEDGQVLGYASASQYQTRAAYAWSVSVSVYLDPAARSRGVGKKLYERLFEILKSLGYFNAYAGITLPNPASVALHKSMGFTQVGLTPKVGYKGGAWHDVALLWKELQPHTLEPPMPEKFTAHEI